MKLFAPRRTLFSRRSDGDGLPRWIKPRNSQYYSSCPFRSSWQSDPKSLQTRFVTWPFDWSLNSLLRSLTLSGSLKLFERCIEPNWASTHLRVVSGLFGLGGCVGIGYLEYIHTSPLFSQTTSHFRSHPNFCWTWNGRGRVCILISVCVSDWSNSKNSCWRLFRDRLVIRYVYTPFGDSLFRILFLFFLYFDLPL